MSLFDLYMAMIMELKLNGTVFLIDLSKNSMSFESNGLITKCL